MDQSYWKNIAALQPDVFVWSGDNIYGDTDQIEVLKKKYDQQLSHQEYLDFKAEVPILATWDDHDYGKNDVGADWSVKKQSQQLFLDFTGVANDDPIRQQNGIYNNKVFETAAGSVNIILLDTRYFRSPLVKNKKGTKRYTPTKDTTTTLLGKQQWKWLEETLATSTSKFNVIVTSIQFLSREHGWETWGNFPHEITKMEKLLQHSGAKNILFLSGDRHISEFSKQIKSNLQYPIIDFTSSGLTHAYQKYKGESNRYRIQEVYNQTSFGIVSIDLFNNQVDFKIYNTDGKLAQQLSQNYK